MTVFVVVGALDELLLGADDEPLEAADVAEDEATDDADLPDALLLPPPPQAVMDTVATKTVAAIAGVRNCMMYPKK